MFNSGFRKVFLRRKFLVLVFILFTINAEIFSATLYKECSSHINKIVQDHDGYVWLATDNGLFRYDGFHTKAFTRASYPDMLSDMVLTVCEDSRNQLWIGTNAGIQKFNRDSESFETPRLSYPGIPDFTYVNSIIEDAGGNLWFTTSRSGLVCFPAKMDSKGGRQPLCYLTSNSSICSDRTMVVFEDKFGNIWVGSNDAGVTMFNPANRTMTSYNKEGQDGVSLSGNMVYSITQSKDGDLYIASLDGGVDKYSYRTHRISKNEIPVAGKTFVLSNDDAQNVIYVGTDGNGILRYDISSGAISSVDPDVREFNVRNSKVHDIMKDSNGNLWAAVYQRGALIIPSYSSGMENLGYNYFDSSRNIGNDPVLSILRDSSGILWVGTDGDGVYSRGGSEGFRHIDGAMDPGIVMCLFEDSKGNIWAGEYLGGLYRYDGSSGHFRKVALPVEGGLGTVNSIAEDNAGRLWLATNEKGVFVYDPANGTVEHLYHSGHKSDDNQICSNTVHTVCFDRSGGVWIGTSDAGISLYNPSTGRMQQYNLGNRLLNNNCVYSIVEDRSGNIWVATASGLVSVSAGKSYILNASNGVPDAPVYALELDDAGHLWFCGQGGIGVLDVSTRHLIRNLSTSRLGVREFKRGASFADSKGNIYFGGVGGAVYFNPARLKSAGRIGKVRLGELTLAPSTSRPDASVIPLYGKKDIRLDYSENTFTVSFGAFEFLNAEDVVYSVLLENYNDSWMELPSGVQSVSFTELPPGTYVLHVRALLGEDESTLEMPLIVSPPPYRTTTAMVGYGIVALLLLGMGAWLFRKNSLNRREHRRLLQEERIKEEKLQFFTDISHEVRTPLTLILGPIAGLKQSATDKKTIHTYEMMESNGQRILRMIDQVIDLRKYDNQRMRLELGRVNIRDFVNQICSSFSNVLAAKGIAFTLSFSDEVPELVWIDSDKIDKVVFNVLANATRFTPQKGRIGIEVDIDGNNDLRIRVSDSGPGIPEDMREAVFERFYQVKPGKETGGTGIGLHLSRKMMASHHGNIFVEETGEHGTTFAIIIPLGEEKYAADHRVEAPDEVSADSQRHAVPMGLEEAGEGTFEISGVSKPHTVLVIDDDVAITSYIKENLSQQYNVITASDGRTGLEAVLRHRPHCVITDIMLEGIDGLEVCRKIRSNSEICDIPVIMLTAKASEEQRIEGIETGADSYIVKPFNMKHLRARVSTLIQSRRVMKEKFANSGLVNESVVGLKTSDEKLLSRLETVVVEEISNPDLSVQFIADKIGVSRSHLHRKLKELTNTNPVAYIKQERMKHALILLNEKGMSVSEVAFATGFNSLSHFSTVFKEFYGMSPSKYVLLNPPRDKSENK